MRTWLLMSITLATVVIPLWRASQAMEPSTAPATRRQARSSAPRAKLRRALIELAVFTLLWGFACIKLYWRLPE